jgi:predicted MFS family arabinose efflux permease
VPGGSLACVAVATIIGALAVSRVGDRIRPAWLIVDAFLVAAAAVFPITGALLALSMIYGLTQREFRDFGTEASETLSACGRPRR